MVIVVEAGQSIQAAVDAAVAGDTVVVREGVYEESVTVGPGKERLRLVAEGPGEAVLDGAELPGTVGVVIRGASGVTVAGFTIRNFPRGGIAVESDGNVLRNNRVVKNGGTGINVRGARNLVQGNTVRENAAGGLRVADGVRNLLIGNRLAANTGEGISVASSAPYTLVLENEVCDNGGTGIAAHGDGAWVIANKVQGNGGEGLAVQGAYPFVYGNAGMENRAAGLEVSAVGLAALKNKLSRNGAGGFEVVRTAEGPAGGLAAALVWANELSYNAAAGFQGNGAVSHSLLAGNDVGENGGHGMALAGAAHSRVLGNRSAANAGCGIDVGAGASGNLVAENDVGENREGGIRIDGTAAGNIVRDNRLQVNAPAEVLADAEAQARNRIGLDAAPEADTIS